MQQARARLALLSSGPMAIIFVLLLSACQTGVVVTDGTVPRRYPYEAPILGTIDVQLFRDNTNIEIVNHTAITYESFDLWLNERYLRHIRQLRAGGRIRLSLREFADEHSEGLKAGGFLSTGRPDPIVKAEIETEEGLVGLIVIPAPDEI